MLKNKWNNRLYSIVEFNGPMVTLKRDDGSEFEIQVSEMHFSYVEVKHD
jgi:hypothetical protein